MEIKKVAINEVRAWKDNPRSIKTKDFQRLKKQIKELGVYKPLIAFKEYGGYTILGGNMRLLALQELGKEDTKQRIHPTQKPVELALWFFNRWGKVNDLIVDPFLGSGSTLIAAEKLDRRCYGMEIEPKYCDIIIKRFCDFTDTSESEVRATMEQ